MSISQQPHSRKLIAFLKAPLAAKMDYIKHLIARLKGVLYYRQIFASFGSNSVIYKPMLIGNPRFIHIGNNVSIRDGARLEAVISDPANPPELRIGDNVNIEQNVHITCHSRVVIGKDVSIAGGCAIVDVTHPYQDVDDPRKIGDRLLLGPSFVEIGDRSLLGFNAIVLPNVRIGTYCIIGAHSLVTRDIPDYSVAVGNPATIQRRYDATIKTWVSTKSTDAV